LLEKVEGLTLISASRLYIERIEKKKHIECISDNFGLIDYVVFLIEFIQNIAIDNEYELPEIENI